MAFLQGSQAAPLHSPANATVEVRMGFLRKVYGLLFLSLIVATVGGFIAGDGGPPDAAWMNEILIKPGIITPEDIVGGGHCMTPKFLRHQFEQSRRNLGVETIDVYYLHNPETQVGEIGPDEY